MNPSYKKWAVLTLDVEDWYHLDYLSRRETDRRYSLLDGADQFCAFAAERKLPATLFVVGEVHRSVSSALHGAVAAGHEIACHGWDHRRPLSLGLDELRSDLVKTKDALESAFGVEVAGYRAPCSSLDRARLDLVRDAGYHYDASRIPFGSESPQQAIDMAGFDELGSGMYVKDSFVEFEVSTHRVMKRTLPIAGGGYLRIFPWFVMGRLLRQYLERKRLFVLHLHPFELSRQPDPPFPAHTSFAIRQRFSIGRSRVLRKIDRLIEMLKGAGFEFTTFSALQQRVVGDSSR